ncbi:TniQ family protein [Nitrospirillum iridis]|uniref:TniQ domain-containing protein n=1 Tax=Nitrospirillum iridis TaxID=765888 RepID=A0A7X0AY56_9PROT|nr:TniQ family protein [Nitrospirillum iridis]MBB6251471.1 hypothetical protein [Nitrospirillum iridis]
MMGMLGLTVPLGELETPASLCSRLAHRNGCGSAAEFCLDMGFSLRRIMDADGDALAKLAEVSGVGVEMLRRGAFIQTGTRMFGVGSEMVPAVASRRNYLRVCPQCLADDMAASPLLKQAAPFQRVYWQMAWFRSCPIHRVHLVSLAEQTKGSTGGEFTNAIRPMFTATNAQSFERTESDSYLLETYLLARLRGEETGAPWLDSLQFHVAAKLCEVIGAMLLFGNKGAMKELGDPALAQAGNLGCGLLLKGVNGLHQVLDRIRLATRTDSNHGRAPKLFSRLYQWLEEERDNSALKPVIDVVHDYIVNHFPLKRGSVVLGREVVNPIMISLSTAATSICVGPVVLRKVLQTKGILDEHEPAFPSENPTFLTEQLAPILAIFGRRITPKSAAEYLHISKKSLVSLADSGILVPFFCGDEDTDLKPQYDLRDLEYFLSLLTARASAEPTPDMCIIRLAVNQAMCPFPEIMTLVLDGKLKRVSKLSDEKGLASFLVDPEEVRAVVWGPELALLDVQKTMKWTSHTLGFLIQEGMLPTHVARKPGSARTFMVIRREDLDDFNAKYATAHTLALESGCTLAEVRAHFRKHHMEPAIVSSSTRATPFYLRANYQE